MKHRAVVERETPFMWALLDATILGDIQWTRTTVPFASPRAKPALYVEFQGACVEHIHGERSISINRRGRGFSCDVPLRGAAGDPLLEQVGMIVQGQPAQ